MGKKRDSETVQGFRADQNDNADDTGRDAGQPPAREALVGGHEMGADNGKKRRGRQDDGGEAARDMALAPGDQRERDKVVEKSHDEKRPPNRQAGGHALADNAENQMQPERGDPDAQENMVKVGSSFTATPTK